MISMGWGSALTVPNMGLRSTRKGRQPTPPKTGARSPSATLLLAVVLLAFALAGPPRASATVLPAKITENTTLTAAGSPYTGSSVTIAEGVVVTAEPGTLVKLSGSLVVSGTLNANGVAETPVIFTSQTNTGKGQWSGIDFNAGSAGVLDHAEVRYAGSGGAVTVNGGASPTIKDSSIHDNTNQAIHVTAGGSSPIHDNTLVNNGNSAIYYFAASGKTGKVDIHDNLVEGSANYGIFVTTAGSSVTGATIGENTIKENGGGAIAFQGGDIPPDIDDNAVSGNGGGNKLFLAGTLTQSASWIDHGYPIRVEGASLTISTGTTLTLGAGLAMKTDGEEIVVNGTLSASGSAESPVVFTSTKDTAAGQWKGITFNSGSGASVLNHTEVRYAGSGSSSGAIKTVGSSPTIENSTIRNNTSRAIHITNGGAPEISNNAILSNGFSAIFYQQASGKTGEVRIHGNLIEGSANFGIFVETYNNSVVGATLGGNTIKNNTGGAVAYEGGDLPPDLDENTLSGNGGSNRFLIYGTFAQSATWTDFGYPIRVESGSLTIAKGANLTLGSGLTLKFDNQPLTVDGTLKAEGSAEKPVLFTSLADTGKGQWVGIIFNSGSSGSVLNHAEVRYTGSGSSSGAIKSVGSSPTIENSTIRNNTSRAVHVTDGGAPEIADNTILANGNSGIFYQQASGKTGEVRIHDNLIEGSENFGIFVETYNNSVVGATVSGNTIKDNSGGAIAYEGGDLPADFIKNTLSGNGGGNRVFVYGTVSQSATWTDPGYPIRVESGSLTIAKGAGLTLGAGLVLKFDGQPLTVEGTLKAEGSAEKPVLFTSLADTGKGQWGGITFESGSSASVLDHAEVRYTGTGASAGGGAIMVDGTSPTIKNSTIRDNTSRAIHVTNGGAPEIDSNAIITNGKSGIFYQQAAGKSGEVKIHDNLIAESENFGIFVETYDNSVTGATVAGNTITGNAGGAIAYEGGDLPPDLTENTLSGNGNGNRFFVYGTVSQSATWTDPGYPIRVESGSLTIANGATLILGADLTIKFDEEELIVKGALKATGSVSEPVLFTGIKDEAPGEWKSIKFEPGSGESVLDHVEVAYGGSASSSGMIEMRESHPTVTNSTIRKSENYGIKVTESGAPTITRNLFRGNANGLFYSGTGTLLAAYNDWGCANGPKPAGCGDSVTSKVNWKPAVQLPETSAHCRGGESQCGEGADPVSLATGQLTYSHRDLILSNKGSMPLEFTRAYSSGSSADAGLGPGWSQTGLASATELESGDVLVLRQDGRQDLFLKTPGGSYLAPSGVTDSLVEVEGAFRLTTLENTVHQFDGSGRIASITDDHGLTTLYGYDSDERLTTITDASSQTLTFSYNASNHIASVKDSTSREVKYTYSGAGDLVTVTDALGGVTKYSYDSAHRMTSITDPRGNVILQSTYDGQGRIVEQLDGLENLWQLEYKEGETTVTEPEGGELTYGFDGQNRVVSEEDQLGHTTTTSYDEAGNVDEIVKPGGAKWVFGHDAAGNLTSVLDPEEGERSYEYDGQNRLTGFTDEREGTWAYEWDEDNDLVKVTDPAEGETTFTHDAAGLPLTATDPNENTTTFTYDSKGNRLTAEDALEHTTAFSYNSRSQLTSKTRSGLEAEEFGRNALGDLLSVTTPEGNKTEYAYNANGMLIQVTDPAKGLWEVERDAMERPVAYVDPLEQETEISYDGNLRPTSVTDRRGKETTYAYDLANQLTEVVKPEGGDWEFDYDARGNRIEAVEPRENATTYEYDLLDRMTGAAEPLEATSSYEYDPAGNLIAFTDPRGNATGLTYDELGRLSDVDQPLEKTTSFTYDPAGNWLTRTTAAGTIELDYDAANRLQAISEGETALRSYDYDAANRMTGATDAQADEIEIGYDDDSQLISVDDGRGQTVAREYDSRGNVVKQADGRGTLEYEYDKLSRMVALTDPQSKILDFGYDPEGNLTNVELPNGVVTTNEYDDAGRLADTTSTNGEAILESLAYEYDPFGNRIGQVDRLSQKTTYEYDALNRLVEFNPPGEGSAGYGYDKAGNRTEAGGITYGFNALNQLTSASNGTSYEYDDAGRLVEIDQGETATTYGWDALDQLTNVDTGTQEIDYAYDAFGRQVLRDDASTIRPSHYGDLSDLPILDTDAEGEPTMSYVQGAGGLVEQRAGEATAFPLRDAHGDITTITDGEGEVASRQTYDPWGDQLSGPSLEMGWLGAQQRRSDPVVALTQMGARPYVPTLGGFLSEDPILGYLGLGVSLNRSAYGWNNPLLYYDLNGRSVLGDIGGAIGDTWNATDGRIWDETAGIRDFVGIAGDGNGGWLGEVPDYISDRAQDFAKSDVGKWVDDRITELERTFTCIAERVVQQPGPVGCQEEAERWEPEPEDPKDPPSIPPPGVPGKTPVPKR